MALTATEEALVRQLLDQQAAILSLAGNESTITSKLGATKVTIDDLTAATTVADADLMIVRQGGVDKKLPVSFVKSDPVDLSSYAPLASPALTGTPTAPTAALGTNTTQIATTAFAKAEAAAVAVSFASSAENAAGTVEGKAVDPLGIREALNASGSAPVYACRAWVNFDGTGTVAIRAAGNVSSITDNGVSDYTVNFTTAMPDTNYCVQRTVSGTGGFGMYGEGGAHGQAFGLTTTSVRLEGSRDSNSGRRDADQMHVSIFR